MTAEQAALSQALEMADRIAARLAASQAALGDWFPVTAAALDAADPARETEADAFLKRFEQLQDAATKRVFRLVLVLLGEPIAGFSARDATDRMAALGAIEDADRWFEGVQLRNRLAHDYPVDGDKRAERMNAVWRASEDLAAQWLVLRAFAASLQERER